MDSKKLNEVFEVNLLNQRLSSFYLTSSVNEVYALIEISCEHLTSLLQVQYNMLKGFEMYLMAHTTREKSFIIGPRALKFGKEM